MGEVIPMAIPYVSTIYIPLIASVRESMKDLLEQYPPPEGAHATLGVKLTQGERVWGQWMYLTSDLQILEAMTVLVNRTLGQRFHKTGSLQPGQYPPPVPMTELTTTYVAESDASTLQKNSDSPTISPAPSNTSGEASESTPPTIAT